MTDQTADDEREARTRLLGIRARDEMCEIDAGNVGEQACKIDRRELLRQFDATRLALAAAQTELAQAREEIEDWRSRLATKCGEVLAAWREIDKAHAEIARLKSPFDADAMEIATEFVRRYFRLSNDGAAREFARAIEAAKARGRKAGIEEARECVQIVADTFPPSYVEQKAFEAALQAIESALASQPPSAPK